MFNCKINILPFSSWSFALAFPKIKDSSVSQPLSLLSFYTTNLSFYFRKILDFLSIFEIQSLSVLFTFFPSFDSISHLFNSSGCACILWLAYFSSIIVFFSPLKSSTGIVVQQIKLLPVLQASHMNTSSIANPAPC